MNKEEKVREVVKLAIDEVARENAALLDRLSKEENSNGTKFDSGKPTMSLIPADALVEVARVLEFGKRKYDANNWRKGITYERLLSAAGRHIAKYSSHLQDDMDEESGIHHLAHAVVNLMMVIQFDLEDRGDLDDRYKG